MTDLGEILRVAGPWGGPVVVIGLLYARGYLATGRERDYYKDALGIERQERVRERQELREELVFWRDMAWSTSKIADQVVGALPSRRDQP